MCIKLPIHTECGYGAPTVDEVCEDDRHILDLETGLGIVPIDLRADSVKFRSVGVNCAGTMSAGEYA
jgi:hypothetical protein